MLSTTVKPRKEGPRAKKKKEKANEGLVSSGVLRIFQMLTQ